MLASIEEKMAWAQDAEKDQRRCKQDLEAKVEAGDGSFHLAITSSSPPLHLPVNLNPSRRCVQLSCTAVTTPLSLQLNVCRRCVQLSRQYPPPVYPKVLNGAQVELRMDCLL